MEFNATKRTEDEAVCDDRHLANQISAARNSNPVRNSLRTMMRNSNVAVQSTRRDHCSLNKLKIFPFQLPYT